MIFVTAVSVALLTVAMPGRADDAADCRNAEALLKTNPTGAVAACRRLADQGDAVGQYNLGQMYATGQGVPKDYTEALKWYRKAADQGFALAQFNLGIMYATGQGVPKDYTEALKWYRKDADQGDADGQYNLGQMYATGHGVPKDYTEALKWYRKAADQGDAVAQYNLGIMYEHGRGVPKDYAKAVEWFRKAADQGNAIAQGLLGYMYYEGQGVPKDYTKAVEWYRTAADQGDAGAQTELGDMYETGRGVPKDYVLAYMWFDLGTAGGFDLAAKRRDMVEKLMTAQQIAEAQKLSREWKPVGVVFPVRAESEAEDAFRLGWKYYAGIGVPTDRAKAIALFCRAYELGSVPAKGILEFLPAGKEADAMLMAVAATGRDPAPFAADLAAQLEGSFAAAGAPAAPEKVAKLMCQSKIQAPEVTTPAAEPTKRSK